MRQRASCDLACVRHYHHQCAALQRMLRRACSLSPARSASAGGPRSPAAAQARRAPRAARGQRGAASGEGGGEGAGAWGRRPARVAGAGLAEPLRKYLACLRRDLLAYLRLLGTLGDLDTLQARCRPYPSPSMYPKRRDLLAYLRLLARWATWTRCKRAPRAPRRGHFRGGWGRARAERVRVSQAAAATSAAALRACPRRPASALFRDIVHSTQACAEKKAPLLRCWVKWGKCQG